MIKNSRLKEIDNLQFLDLQIRKNISLNRISAEMHRKELEWYVSAQKDRYIRLEKNEARLKELEFIYYTRYGVFP